MTNWTACTIFCVPLFTMSKESSHNSGVFILAHSFSATFVFTMNSFDYICTPLFTMSNGFWSTEHKEISYTFMLFFIIQSNIEKYK